MPGGRTRDLTAGHPTAFTSMNRRCCWRLEQTGNPLIEPGLAVQITGTTSNTPQAI